MSTTETPEIGVKYVYAFFYCFCIDFEQVNVSVFRDRCQISMPKSFAEDIMLFPMVVITNLYDEACFYVKSQLPCYLFTLKLLQMSNFRTALGAGSALQGNPDFMNKIEAKSNTGLAPYLA